MPNDYATTGLERLRAALRGSPEDDFAYGEGIPPEATWRNLIPAVELGLSIAPGSGEAMAAQEAWDASGRGAQALNEGRYSDAVGDYLDWGTATLGAVPVLGTMARGTRRGAAWMDQNLPSWINKGLDYIYPSDPRSTMHMGLFDDNPYSPPKGQQSKYAEDLRPISGNKPAPEIPPYPADMPKPQPPGTRDLRYGAKPMSREQGFEYAKRLQQSGADPADIQRMTRWRYHPEQKQWFYDDNPYY